MMRQLSQIQRIHDLLEPLQSQAPLPAVFNRKIGEG